MAAEVLVLHLCLRVAAVEHRLACWALELGNTRSQQVDEVAAAVTRPLLLRPQIAVLAHFLAAVLPLPSAAAVEQKLQLLHRPNLEAATTKMGPGQSSLTEAPQ
mmetsp:Transcript_71198/g.137408  ORF Transcript_71198/g.137408 Transcript_71198/m.137408 type:complete len:104 (-) Transcript_71198:1430-1741(-)